MTQELEIELKNLLIKDEFKHLYASFNFAAAPVVQTNYYFETKDLDLKKCGAALRIRTKNNAYTLTLKEPHVNGLLETHDTLTSQKTEQWLNDKGTFEPNTGPRLEGLNIQPESLSLVGDLTTRRWEIEYNTCQIVLDQSFYLGKEDYELEVEGPSEASVSNVYNELLRTAGIDERDTPNKIKRLYNTLTHWST